MNSLPLLRQRRFLRALSFILALAGLLFAGASHARAELPSITLVSPPGTTVGAYVGTSSLPFRFAVESDSAYTEKWFKDNAAIAESAKYALLPGELRIRNLDYTDEGHYFLEVTNATGTRSSVVIWLRVLEPPPDPVISRHPQSAALAYGDPLFLEVETQSAGPYAYRWYKDGAPIPSGTNPYYSVYSVTKANAGSYHVVVSGPTASATSNAAVITVADPVPPVIVSQPQDVSIQHGSSAYVSVDASGSRPLTFRLYRGTTLVSESTGGGHWFENATQTETAGTYEFEISNTVGSVRSRPFTVSVSAPVPPTITLWMTSTTVSVGDSLGLSGNVTGSQPMVIQWFKDGVPVREGNSSSAWISNVTTSHSGVYTLRATNAGGTATSADVVVTVRPPQPPSIQSYYQTTYTAYLGGYMSLNYANITGTGPLTYTWYKDGQVVATGGSWYSKSAVTYADEGMYWLEVTSPYGSAAGEPFYVQVVAQGGGSSSQALHAVHDGILYVVAPGSAILRRYDLDAGAWLEPVSLGFVPRGLAVNQHGIFAGNGRALQRFTLSVENPANVRNFSTDIREILAGTNFLFVASGDYVTPVIETIEYGTWVVKGTASSTYSMAQMLALNADNSLIVGRDTGLSPSDIYRRVVNADGTFGAILSSPYHGDYGTGTQLYFIDGGSRIVENSGVIYHSGDLTFAGSFAGAFSDLVELEPGRVVLARGRRVLLYEGGQPTSHHDFASGVAFLVRHGESLFSFSLGADGTVAAESVALDAISDEIPLQPVVQPEGRRFSPAAVEYMDDLLFLYDRVAGNVHVFDVAAFAYAESIPLRGRPTFFRLERESGAMFTAYSDGSIWRLDDASGLRERFLTVLPGAALALVPVGSYLFANDGSGAWSTNYTFNADTGAMISSEDWAYRGVDYLWSPARSRVYFLSTSVSPSDIQYVTIGADGRIGSSGDSPYHGNTTIANPLRANPAEGLLLTGAGTLYDAVTLSAAGAIGNGFVDAAWTSSVIASIRADGGDTEIQLWNPNSLTLTRSARISGEPLRIFALAGGRFLVLGSVDGVPVPSILSASLAVEARLLPLSPDQLDSLPDVPAAVGDTVVLDALPEGGPGGATFVWRHDGEIVAGQNSRHLDLGSLSADEAGLYSVEVTYSGQTITSNVFWVGPDPEASYLSNVSTRSYTEGGNRTLVMGFVLEGAGTKPLLMRTAGPALVPFGIAGALADPVMRVYAGSDPILVNDNWQDPADYLTTGRRALDLGAFGFSNLSGDAALLTEFAPGAYTIHADAAPIGSSGVVLAEIYDAHTVRQRLSAPRIANFSARTEVRTGDDILILGFVIEGNIPMRLLVRGIGPTLGVLGVGGSLPDSKIEVFQGGTIIAENDNWGGTPELVQAFSSLGAFELAPDSRDAALIITLEPGVYTAVVRGVNDVTGIALAELYRMQ